MPEVIGENIDRLVSVEMRFGAGLPRGTTHRLYEAARRKQGGKPLTYLAGKALVERVKPGDFVLVATGAGAPPGLPKGETDGPLGGAAIARAVDLALGARSVITTEERHVAPIVASVEAAGVSILDEAMVKARPHAAVLEPFPLGVEEGRRKARELFEKYNPKAVVFVEKAGPNDKGLFHSILGYGRGPSVMASAFHLVDMAKERGAVTIGIGDGGNEIGFGIIREAVQEIQPYGKMCRCECKGGIATVTGCDILVAAAISNWGAYGVAAMLAFLTRKPEVVQDPETEAFMLQACVMTGGADGAFGSQTLNVDGTPAFVQRGLVEMLRVIVDNGLRESHRGF